MIARRELFKLMGGAGVAAATVKPSEILAEANKMGGASLAGTLGNPPSDVEVAGKTPIGTNSWQIMDVLDEERRWARTEPQFMDFDIQSKKSWSPAFKSIIYSQRERENRELKRQLEKNEKLLLKAAKMLGMSQ